MGHALHGTVTDAQASEAALKELRKNHTPRLGNHCTHAHALALENVALSRARAAFFASRLSRLLWVDGAAAPSPSGSASSGTPLLFFIFCCANYPGNPATCAPPPRDRF